MARPKSRRRRSTADLSRRQLRHRMTSALTRGAFQKAQELAQTLYKREPTPETHQYVVEATLKRAVQLRRAGDGEKAIPGLKHLAAEGIDDPKWALPCIRELMLSGEWEAANSLSEQFPNDNLRAELLTWQVDAVLLQGADSLGYLPDTLQADARAVLHALSELEHGRDTAAEAAVAGLGADSPLYDWKCLVQGLTAFYQGADALEHWQTLTPSRVPATLAAPFQVQLDPAALAEHPDRDAFVAFGRQHFQDEWLADLEAAQGGIDIEEMSHVLTHASRAAQAVPSEQHALRDRLARTVYWLMAKHGFEEELGLYTAVFDPPPDDPSLHRLRALMHEQAGDKAEAQRAWATYAAELDQLPMIRAEDRALAGGLIWFHMGNVAERAAPRPPMGGFPFLADVDDEAPAFDGLHCYQQSAQMAPTLLIAHEAAIDRLQAAGRQREKVQAARHLLRHFPEHEQALVVLADDAFRRDRWDQAVAFQTRAVQARPHVEELRATLGFYELGLARLRAQQGKFDAARAILSTQLDQAKPAEKARLLCRQAAVELKAGEHALGESLYDQARTVALSPLTAALDMLIEAVRMPVEAQWIRTVEQAFRQELKGEWHSLSACYLLDVVSAFASLNIDYEAYEQHQKWVFQYLRRGLKLPLSEAELCHICNGLKYFASQKLLLDYARRGQKEYPEHPLFPLSQAVHYVMRDPEKCPWDKADDLLHTAHDLAAADPAHAELLEPIDALLSRVHSAMERQRFNALTSLQGRALDDLDELSPFEALNALQRLFGDLLDDDDDDDDIVDFFNPFGPPPGRRRSRSPSRRKKSSRRKR